MKRQSGFTLIEMLIVVAVIAILAAIAVPTYNEQVRKSHRGGGKAVMLQTVQALERFHTVNNTYSGYTPTNFAAPEGSTGTAQHYELEVSNLGVATYTITAVPKNGQLKDKCLTLSISHTGAKTPATDGCW